MLNDVQETITSFGTYYWERLYWDGNDWHFSNGRVDHCHARDLNDFGQIVGEATLEGRGTNSYGYQTHGYLVNAPGTTKINLTPDATSATASGINNSGTIVGSVAYGGATQGFRRARDGTMHHFSVLANISSATAINEAGLVVGQYNTNYLRPRPFASDADSSMVDMGLPSQASPNCGRPNDVNIHGVVVGTDWDVATSYEKQAVRWHRDASGNWIAEDLNELLADGEYLLENAITINDAGYIIARGRPDGSDAFGSGTYLLTPDIITPTLAGPLLVAVEPGEDGLAAVTWPTSSGFNYTLRCTTNWLNWTAITNLIGTGTPVSVPVWGGASGMAVFRVECMPE